MFLSNTLGDSTTYHHSGNANLSFPSGAVNATTTITFTERTIPSEETGSSIFAGQSFQVDATDNNGNPVTNFNADFTMQIYYSELDWVHAGVAEETALNLAYWDENTGQWIELLPCDGCTLDTQNNIITIILGHLTEFALLGEARYTVYIPLVLR